MLKCDFNKVALQLYWNHTSAWVFYCKFIAYFQNIFFWEHLWVAASVTLRERFNITKRTTKRGISLLLFGMKSSKYFKHEHISQKITKTKSFQAISFSHFFFLDHFDMKLLAHSYNYNTNNQCWTKQ